VGAKFPKKLIAFDELLTGSNGGNALLHGEWGQTISS
jgi:hypothetical protein